MPRTICPECGKAYGHLFVGECCSACDFKVRVVAEAEALASAHAEHLAEMEAAHLAELEARERRS